MLRNPKGVAGPVSGRCSSSGILSPQMALLRGKAKPLQGLLFIAVAVAVGPTPPGMLDYVFLQDLGLG